MSRQPSSRGRSRTDPLVSERIEQALAANDIARAATIAQRALANGRVDPMILNLAAWQKEEAGQYAAAHALLRQALALSPNDFLILAAIGAVLRKEGRLGEALDILDRVVGVAPGHAAAWLERGYVLDAMRATRDACASYARALVLDATLAPALGKLADAAARAGDAEAARTLATRSLALNPGEPSAIFALATIELEARNGVAAESLLTASDVRHLAGDDRTRALTLLGDALDRQDRTKEAFANWQQAQQNFRTIYAGVLEPGPNRPSHRAFVENIYLQVKASSRAGPSLPVEAVKGEAGTHVFLLGYPRSGTTLVENVLASSSNVVALEERDTFRGIDRALISNNGAMPPLDGLDPELVRRLRSDYWERVRSLAGDVTGKFFVDMNPFNGIKLPVIARLFPAARILVMRRDPRDIVLSCFRINFTPSPATWAFSDLEEAARHYDAQMKLTDLCLSTLPIAAHDVRYDQLVVNFEETVRAMAAFLELPWTEAFKTFDRTAKDRGVRTASATQVRKGLYDGRGQWQRYADALLPVMPILSPWVESLGFAD